MEIVLIVVVGILVVLAIVGFALAPTMNKKGDAAAAQARELIGADPLRLDHKVIGLGTEPEEAGGLRGMGALAVSDTTLAFVTWAPRKAFVVPRANISSVTTEAADPRATDHSTIEVHLHHEEEGAVVAKFRVKSGLHDWLDAFGYDWGPEGRPPAPEVVDAED